MNILILAYNRLDNLERLLSSLKNSSAKVYISVDGGTDPRCLDVQKFCKDLAEADPEKFLVQISDQNLGVKRGVIKGIDWFFSLEQKGLILEEDLEFLIEDVDQFLLAADPILSQPDTIINLSAFVDLVDIKHTQKLEFNLQNDFYMWGWACNGNTWKSFKATLESPNFSKFLKSSYVSNVKERLFWILIIRMLKMNQIDSWGYLFLFFAVTSTVNYVPNISLVRNTGLRSGSNYSILSIYKKALGLTNLNIYNPNDITFLNIQDSLSFQRNKIIRHNINLFSIARLLLWNIIPVRKILKRKFV